ncbi:MAG: hypothetical protein K5804_17785 [Microbacterium sp.]|uniref:hypothetical protein n=1 Tax=Microbacterium sp. TaxID=51671 RepID=UPI002619AB4F|nr:hypothetical protein [Microbacterium sp.]MCV0420096.1 hypothetical protein [Microbacterium sp.]
MNNIPKPSRITVTTDDLELINDLQRGYDSRELIDLYGIKFAATQFSVNAAFPVLATMRAKEVRMIDPLPWSGFGLPPVGSVCEVDNPHSPGEWHECTILVHDGEIAVFGYCNGYPYVYDGQSADGFRPIRTAEQIAAEERNDAINKIVAIFPLVASEHEIGAALYDAGLRFQKGEDQ